MGKIGTIVKAFLVVAVAAVIAYLVFAKSPFGDQESSHGEWRGEDGYSVTFVDEAGHQVDGLLHRPVSWNSPSEGQIGLVSWDDAAEFHLAKDPEFPVPNQVVRQRLKVLHADRSGTLSGNIMEVTLIAWVDSRTDELVTGGGPYVRFGVEDDDVGKRLFSEMGKKEATVNAELTGKTYRVIMESPDSFFSGSISSSGKIQYLKIRSFEPYTGK